MTPFTDGLTPEEFADETSTMLGLGKDNTGLKYFVLLDSLGKERKRKNNSPRLMIDLNDDFRDIIPISIDKFNPQILIDREVPNFENIADWIKENYVYLMMHWNQEINDFEAVILLTVETEKIRQLRKEFKPPREFKCDATVPKWMEEVRKERTKKLKKLQKEKEADQNVDSTN